MRVGTLVSVAISVAGAVRADTAKIGALVLDAETRQPVEGVAMTGHFEMSNGWLAWKGSATPNMVDVETDREGRCRASARTNMGRAGWHVEKVPEGYYRPVHGGWWEFKRKNLLGVWQPDDAVSTVLVQRVGHPIPLVGRSVHGDIVTPARVDLIGKAGGRLGYDFLRGDWLPPVGRGETADVVFVREPPVELGMVKDELSERTGRSYRQRVTMRFPGKDNGIVEAGTPDYSVPRIRTAPEGGYGPGLDFEYEVDKALEEVRRFHPGKAFAFRIRARRDEQGRLVEAYYGKIYGGLEVEGARGAVKGTYEDMGEPRFSYFLNPASLDRNLEWDQKTVLKWNPGAGRLEPLPRYDGHKLFLGWGSRAP
ncbi:MAG: hypothetical protein Q4G65_11120 [bacterium]|nr:hypothetical protein [bacterium]